MLRDEGLDCAEGENMACGKGNLVILLHTDAVVAAL